MDLPEFTAITPVVIPAVAEKVFDKYWLRVFITTTLQEI